MSKKENKINFPQYVSGNARAVSVVGYITDKKADYEDGKGYLDDDGYIWIFCSMGKPKNCDEYPYFWYEGNNIVYSIPDDEIKEKFSVNNMIDNRLKGKTDQKYVLPNMKAALENKTKMSVVYFCCWMELLGCDFQIDIVDNGLDTTNRLTTDLIYTSSSDKVYKNLNGELIELYNSNKGDDENEVD